MKHLNEENSVCNSFAKKHKLQLHINKKDYKLIYLVVKLREGIDRSFEEKDMDKLSIEEPTWAILQSMLHRVFENMEGVIISYATGCWSSVEVLARVTMESSVTVMYILDRDRTNRLVQYFNYYSLPDTFFSISVINRECTRIDANKFF